ncbi:hypothetical protein O3G_MSEX014276 [Manduca sexta]|uniref:EGF-like domain-containing protein n=1 Tax=Manduca sexta TaxID=7130 RepID=A0A922CZF0_MANSE|nr:hypothetical protein O3G_MSEX014276 [Manduca sexta]KAG6464107.1 hypothetical protein O3G_MSEX014276 [Manduca sexta]
MSRLNGRITGNPADLGDFEPSCLVRTPSGNFYVPSGEWDIQKNPSMDYKSNSSCSSPGKQDKSTLERMDRSDRSHPAFGAPVPVLPVRNNLRASHFPPAASRFHFRKGLSSRCTWKCTAIVFIILFVLLLAIASYMSASYFVNWSYQNSKACTVLVGDSTEMFPTSKATTLEASNKSLVRQTPPSAGSGNEEAHSRHRRSVDVDGHASQSVSSMDPSTAVDMHEISTPVITTDVSLAHGVVTEAAAQVSETDQGANAFVSANVSSQTGVLTKELQPNDTSVEVTTASTTTEENKETTKLTTNIVKIDKIPKDPQVEVPPSVISEKPVAAKIETDNIAYDPDDMQGDSFPTVYSYGVLRLQYLKRLAKYKKIMEESHILPNDTADGNIEKIHYENVSITKIVSTTNNPVTTTSSTNDTPITKANEVIITTNTFAAPIEHVVTTTPAPSVAVVTNNNLLLNTTATVTSTSSPSTTSSTSTTRTTTTNYPTTTTTTTTVPSTTTKTSTETATTEATESTTVNTAKTRTPELSNAKHVLINLTISADDADSSYKPLYSLAVTVPTLGDSNEIPTVKITPMDVEPTAATNFNKPVIVEGVTQTTVTQEPTKTTKQFNVEDEGGMCECSCPVCNSNYTDEAYDDYSEKSTTDATETETSTDGEVQSTTDSQTEKTETSTEVTTETEASTTDISDTTTDFTTESFLMPTTKVPQCVCPKVTPPPILILEGPVHTFAAQSFPPDGTTFKQITLGEKLSKEIHPYSYWNMQFYQSQAAYVKFDYMIPRGASIGVYARRNALPTHTQYHFLEVLSGFKARTTRASHPSVKKELTHYMEQGHWFLSLYNDDGDPQEITFIAMVAEEMTHNCPNGCSGKGECLMGHCQCQPGFGGDDCSKSVCPVLCSQRGEYINGECQCNPGWKGKECSLRHDECEVPDCNGHGHCVNGKCSCVRGYKGKFCGEVDCTHPTCSGHGFCIEGSCVCKKGWKGLDCATMDKDALQCLPDCSGHGTFDVDTQTCTCHARWSGEDCSKGNFGLYFKVSTSAEVCDLDCGPHGRCVGEACVCAAGWTGEFCTARLCDARCSDHGQCKNGTCLCVSGWNGRHCTLEGCPRGCAGHGQCRVANDGHWECKCFDGWDGPDCTTLKEQICDDSKDNDKDGLVDCEDPECCQSAACKGSQLCVSSPKPTDILLRKQPPAITASFFERMKFLIDEGSLQNYAKQETFNESRSAVIRGRVITTLGSGLVGVRVSTSTPLEGFTLTREDGWFDLLVNGGGAVTLHFGRAPFKRSSQVVFVPWNEVTTPRGSDYLLDYDDSGALQNLTTPRGHIHTFALMTSLGYFKYQYFSPMNRHPYEILYNDDGHILAKIFPRQSGKILYVYDSTGKLETILAGASAIRYVYHENTHLVKNVEITDPDYELKQDYKYHAGILKDEKMKFNSKSSLNNAHFKYQYDGNARLSTIDVNINSKETPQLRLKYNQNLGILEAVSDLRIYRNTFNRSVMQDTSKQFFTITDYDDHGRIKTVLINIKAFDVFRLELEYDVRNRIKTKKMMIGDTSSSERISYNYDGHLMEVVGSEDDWKYNYDENGNVIGIIEHGEKRHLGYDFADRVVQYGDIEFSGYDDRGFVVRRGEQKYRYNSRGQFVHAFERDKFQMWYYYDNRNRLVAWKDDKSNITQFFYSNPQTPNLITHMHYPKTEKTTRFLYDQRDFLTCIETEDQRFYVATDHNGSPLVVFDVNGEIIKELKRSPFGKIIKDTNPGFYVPVDFHGGIFDYNTNLVYVENRLYDPVVGQWMTPSWEHLATKLSLPTDIFTYRFRNNDPINKNQNVPYMTSLASWLQLYGYDMNKMMGSKYITDMIFQPMTSVTAPQLAPDFGVMSGLQCIIEKVNDKLSDIDFVPTPLLKMEPITRNLLPRVSYKRGVFGEGVLISRVDGKAFISVADGANSVVEDVITTVFNNSYFLDVHFSIHDQDVFYFVKDNSLKIRDDMEELRRLSGKFNVSQDEINDQGLEVRVHAVGKGSAQAVIVLRYGVDPAQERIKLLKHAHKRAAVRAWEREKVLVAGGWEGRGSWTEEEKEELISHGIVDGWAAKDVHSVSKYPQLADDPANIVFVRDGRRKRRKSGRARHRS